MMEVADGLRGTGVPLAIFPGGTGNAMAGELGIPVDLAAAVALVASGAYDTRTIDMAMAGDQSFILRIGIGFARVLARIGLCRLSPGLLGKHRHSRECCREDDRRAEERVAHQLSHGLRHRVRLLERRHQVAVPLPDIVPACRTPPEPT